jgi:hypothetical protein
MKYSEFEKYLESIECKPAKCEIVQSGPLRRTLNDVNIYFDFENLKIEYTFSSKDKLSFIDILFLSIFDEAFEVDKLMINSIEVALDEPADVFEKIYSLLVDGNNVAEVFSKYIYYENGCAYYLICPGYPEDYFLNKELES